ncbi:hypothetical protein P8452_57671 [Trifolium repens]|nr:hypothetical protein P8452_57671 [Trifolium repens]
MSWFKGLDDNSFDLWRELCRAFSSHFTARKRQPKTGLRSDTKFKEKLGLKEPPDVQDLLSGAQSYINYEEKMLGEKAERAKSLPKRDEMTKEEKGEKGQNGGYPEYIVLNTSREKILQKCLNSEFADAGIRIPRRKTGGNTRKRDMIPLEDTCEGANLLKGNAPQRTSPKKRVELIDSKEVDSSEEDRDP